MAKIQINNPRQIINGGAKKYYFKVKGLGGPKGDKGDKGDTGDTGPQGPQGNAATVSVGSTTTLPVGYDATVTNSGSIYNAVLDFGIPQGPQGPQGAKGDKGDTGAQGETGPRGPQGERGTNATVYVGTTTTTNPGTQARVYNSGTDSNAVLNFEIPRGDVGPMPTIAQTTGQSTTEAMSQKATTDALNTKQNTIDSSHKLSADLVDDTTTTHKFVSASDKTTWNAKQNALTAGDNITITGTTISTPAIAPEVVAELPATGTEGKLYLTPKNYTRGTGTGNPIEATITDEVGKMESFQLDGDTFQQSYEGKNLNKFPYASGSSRTVHGVTFTANSDGSVTIKGTHDGSGTAIYYFRNFWAYNEANGVVVDANTTITASITGGSEYGIRFMAEGYHSDGTYGQINTTSSQSMTTTAKATFNGRITVDSGFSSTEGVTVYPMIELGSTATTYEPYVGGTPSPNPEYPQPIQTVTGTQTISINGTNYPINLGDIELCKLDTYQDYIWKDGDDWKVHKAVGKAELWKGTNWRRLVTIKAGENRFSVKVSNTDTPTSDSNTTLVLLNSNYWSACTRIQTYQQIQGIAATGASDFSVESFIAFVDSIKTSDVDGWKAWLATNKPVVYYQSTSPTDTIITGNTLIAQLEAIRTAMLQNGTNTITNTATGSNLAGDMEIGYYGFAPRNRYDKWLWLDINNEYEQIGS